MTEQNKQSGAPAPEAHVDAGGYRKGVKDAVTFLHEQAALSKSSTIKTVLDSIANAIGNKFKPIPSTGTMAASTMSEATPVSEPDGAAISERVGAIALKACTESVRDNGILGSSPYDCALRAARIALSKEGG